MKLIANMSARGGSGSAGKKILLSAILATFLPLVAMAALTAPGSNPVQPIPQDNVGPYYKKNINTEDNTGIVNQQQNQNTSPSPTTPASPDPTPTPADNANNLAAQLPPVTTGDYTINGSSNTTTPVLTVGDTVLVQPNNAPPVWGIVTTPLSDTTLSINGVPLDNGTFEISKFGGGTGATVSFTTGSNGSPDWNGASGSYTAPVVGDIVMFQTGHSDPIWGIVTSVGQNSFTINDTGLAPSTAYVMTKGPTTALQTSAIDGSFDSQLVDGMDFAVGDWVLSNNGSGYVWGVVTTAEKIKPGGRVSALRLNGSTQAPIFKVATRVSKVTPVKSATLGAQSGWVYWISLILGGIGLIGVLYWIYIRVRKYMVD
jgi:hypothetical protein